MSRLTAFLIGVILPSLLLAAAPTFEQIFKPDLSDVTRSKGWIYFTDGKDLTIRKASLDGTIIENFINKGMISPSGIAIHHADGMLYWSDVGTHTIERAPLNDASKREVVLEGLNHPYAIQIDEKAGKIYWFDVMEDGLFVANLDGSGQRKLLDKNDGLENPRGFRVIPEKGMIYWADSYHNRIMRSRLDGSGVEEVLSGLMKPYDVEVNLERDLLYWSSSFDDKIMVSDLDGNNPKVFQETRIPMALMYDKVENRLFWTTIYPPSVRSTKENVEQDHARVFQTINPKDLTIIYSSQMKEVKEEEEFEMFYP